MMHRAVFAVITICSLGAAAVHAGCPPARSSRRIFRKKHNLRHE